MPERGTPIQAHVVPAHPELRSFNAHLARVARRALEAQGWTVSLSDLYGMGFDPCERAEHYAARQQPERFDVQAEQRHASEHGTIPDIVAAEIERLDRADLLVLQYPMWRHLPPAMLKGWLDRVLIYGEVYTSRKRFEAGRFIGKRAMLSVTVGTSEATYAFDGRSGDIDLLLWPVNFSLAYVGYGVLSPFIAYGVEAGLRYSDASVVEARLKRVEENLGARLRGLDQVPLIPFNRMAEWPFIRRRQQLDLEYGVRPRSVSSSRRASSGPPERLAAFAERVAAADAEVVQVPIAEAEEFPSLACSFQPDEHSRRDGVGRDADCCQQRRARPGLPGLAKGVIPNLLCDHRHLKSPRCVWCRLSIAAVDRLPRG
jgi:NAD(P)H dehydrogenase (quinone)